MRLPVYVPKLAALATIQPGAAITGSPRAEAPGKLLVDYQDDAADAERSRSYADRVLHAADRHLTGHPTASRLLVDADDLLQVGTFDTDSGVIEVSDRQALQSWLAQAHGGIIPDLDTQTRTTTPPR